MIPYHFETTEEVLAKVLGGKDIVGIVNAGRPQDAYMISLFELINAATENCEEITWIIPDPEETEEGTCKTENRSDQGLMGLKEGPGSTEESEPVTENGEKKTTKNADQREITREKSDKPLGKWQKFSGLQLSTKKAHRVAYDMFDECYSVRQIKDLLRVSDQTVRNWLSRRAEFEKENGIQNIVFD